MPAGCRVDQCSIPLYITDKTEGDALMVNHHLNLATIVGLSNSLFQPKDELIKKED